MRSYLVASLFLLLLIVLSTSYPIAFCDELAYQAQENLNHDDHLNDSSDVFPNDYTSFAIPFDDGKQITIAPVITCASFENNSWYPYHHPCKMAQTILVDSDWSDENANYTYIFEDWIDYDWNDIIVNLYGSTSDGIIADLFLSFREARWKNPFSLEITVEGTWMKIEWNSTEYPDMQSLTVDEGETIEINVFTESDPYDKALVRFLIPPVASFSWYPQQLFVGTTVVFDASTSYDPDKEIVTYSWVFSDGTSVDTDIQAIIHQFMSSGTHNVNLMVVDSDGLTHMVSSYVIVSATIGGETTSLDNALTIIWENTNIILLIAFVAIATLVRRKGNKQL